MMRIRFHSLLALALLVAWALAAPLAGQKPRAAAPGGVRAGIQVHGHWTIVVRNPDGSVAAKREFENSLQFDGITLLPILLSGQGVAGTWAVMAGGSDAAHSPCAGPQQNFPGNPAGVPLTLFGPCVSAPAPGCTYFATGSCQPTLSVSLVQIGETLETSPTVPTPYYALQLSGTAAITQPGNISAVGTTVTVCSAPNSAGSDYSPFSPSAPYSVPNLPEATASPALCSSGAAAVYLDNPFGLFPWYFTATGVPNGPITVVNKQTVQVTVVISFS
jgi:hypothetical protein